MSVFSKILEKIGFGKKEVDEAKEEAKKPNTSIYATMKTKSATELMEEAKARGRAPVDVTAKLEAMAKSNPEELNWKESIVDLLKLLDMDSSMEARKELAKELGMPADLMADSAQMNMWLHKTVIRKMAANGGNVPKELLD